MIDYLFETFQVCQEEEFLQLSSCQLVALIRRDHLNVREERDVYNAVLKVFILVKVILKLTNDVV